MAKKKTPPRKSAPATAEPLAPNPGLAISWIWICAAIVILAYALPLLTENSTIHWDAVDVHYSAQRYFAQHLLRAELPHWTPYIFSGFPFLADPQTGAWYPGNWPFFLAGASPKALEAELALHALLAALGAYLLIRRSVSTQAAAIGALSYSLGGFFAAHSSHIGIFESAALFPWLLLALSVAVDGPFWRGAFWGTLVAGAMILAGHFQTALYVFCGTLLFASALVWRDRTRWLAALQFLGIIAAGALLLSAVQTLPGLELTNQSIRSQADYSASAEATLVPSALATLVLPDALGAKSGDYKGPGDITQFYFYSGILLLPLAALGFRNSAVRTLALCLALPALLYMAGPALGFFRLVSWLPGLRQVRAPVHAWFVVALALSLLAAAGADWLSSRWKRAGALIFAILTVDLCVNNLWDNSLAYAHQSFDSLYGNPEQLTRRNVVPNLPPLTRFDAPDHLAPLGPLNHPLDLAFEATYGYNPLQLSRYAEFRSAIAKNSKLRDSLAVSRGLDLHNASLVEYPSNLARAYFPQELISTASPADALHALASLDPPRQTILEGDHPNIHQDPAATAVFQPDGEQAFRVKYKTATPALLRLATPFYPGWQAEVDGVNLPLLHADYALTAVIVPAGEKELKLRFHSNYFSTGAALTLVGLLLLGGLGWLAYRRP